MSVKVPHYGDEHRIFLQGIMCKGVLNYKVKYSAGCPIKYGNQVKTIEIVFVNVFLFSIRKAVIHLFFVFKSCVFLSLSFFSVLIAHIIK